MAVIHYGDDIREKVRNTRYFVLQKDLKITKGVATKGTRIKEIEVKNCESSKDCLLEVTFFNDENLELRIQCAEFDSYFQPDWDLIVLQEGVDAAERIADEANDKIHKHIETVIRVFICVFIVSVIVVFEAMTKEETFSIFVISGIVALLAFFGICFSAFADEKAGADYSEYNEALKHLQEIGCTDAKVEKNRLSHSESQKTLQAYFSEETDSLAKSG